MALYTDLPAYRDTYQLILKVIEYTKDFPKEYKYTLGQDMKRDALHLLRCIYRANKHKKRAGLLDVYQPKCGRWVRYRQLLELYREQCDQRMGLAFQCWRSELAT